MDDPTICVFGRQGEDGGGTRGGALTRLSDYLYERGEVKASTLHSRIAEFLQSMKLVMQNVPADFGDVQLDSITITIEVNAKGHVALLGAGGEFGGKGGDQFHPEATVGTRTDGSSLRGRRTPAVTVRTNEAEGPRKFLALPPAGHLTRHPITIMAAPQRGQCQRVELSEGFFYVQLSRAQRN